MVVWPLDHAYLLDRHRHETHRKTGIFFLVKKNFEDNRQVLLFISLRHLHEKHSYERKTV